MKAIKLFSTALLILAITTPTFAGGPWLLKKKSAFIQTQAIVPAYRYSSLLTGTFIRDTQGVNRKTFNSDFGFYLEYGVTDKFNVIGKIPFKFVSTGEVTDQLYFENLLPSGSLTGASNVEVDFKYGIVDSHVKVAVSANTLWNTISTDLDKGLATGYNANAFGLTAHVGRGKEKHYGFLEIGFQKFTNDFSDVVEIKIEHGWKLGAKMSCALTLDARQSLENGSYFNANLEQTGLYPNDQSWAAISGKLVYETETGWGANLAVPLVPIRFQNVGFNGTIGLGVYKKFNS